MIVLVEDDEYIRESLSDYLTTMGWQFRVASSINDGLELLKKYSPTILLTDYIFDGSNASSLIKKCQSQYPKCHTILITAMSKTRAKEEAERLRVDRLLVKPFDLSELETTLESFVNHAV